jgi:hypothetical protein
MARHDKLPLPKNCDTIVALRKDADYSIDNNGYMDWFIPKEMIANRSQSIDHLN